MESRVLLAADLSISKYALADEVNAGEDLVYGLSVSNDGPSTATGVVATDTLPAGVEFVGTTNTNGCVLVGSVLSCDLGTLASGASTTFTVKTHIPSGFLSTVDVNANEVQTVTLAGGVAGDTFTLTFAGQTTGALAFNATATAVQTALEGLATIGAGNVAVSGSNGGPYTLTFQGGLAAQNLPQLTGSGTGALTVTVATTTPGNSGDDGYYAITNTASVSLVGGGPDPTPGNNTDSVTTVVKELADLHVTKYVEPVGAILAGQTFTYTIYVDNLGPSNARHVTIRDTLLNSSDVTIQSCAFTVSQGGGSITQFNCNTGNLVNTQFGTDIGSMGTNFLIPVSFDPADPNEPQGRLRASFRLVSKVDGDVTNLTRAFADTPDPDALNNAASVHIEVTPVANLAVTVAATGEEQQVNQAGLIFNNAIPGQAFVTAPNYFASTRVTAGRRIQYSLQVQNNGPSPAQNVVVSDLLPAGVQIYQGSLTTSQGTCDGGTPGQPLDRIECGLGTLAPVDPATPGSGTATITFQVVTDASLEAGTVLTNEADVSSDTQDIDNSNNQAHTDHTVLTAADLTVNKSAVGQNVTGYNATLDRLLVNDVANAVTAGQVLRYQIAVQNNGPSDSQNVTISDALPSTPLPGPVTFVGADGADCRPESVTNDTLFCTLGTLAAGARGTFDIYVRVDSAVPAGTVLSNTATLLTSPSNTTPPGSPPSIGTGSPNLPATWDPQTSDNSATALTSVNVSADVSIDKQSTQQKVVAGTQTHFTIVVENLGPSLAQNVQVVDTLPAGVTYETDTDSCVQGPVGTLTCPIGTLQPGERQSFDIYVLVDPSLPPNTTLTNTATVTSTTPDFNLTNNTDTSTILVLREDTDLAITKVGPSTVEIGTTITYTLTVTNKGPIDAKNVEVRDFLPIGLYPQSYSPAVGNCNGGVVGDALRPTICSLGTMAPGDSVDIVVVAKVGNDVKDLTKLINDALVTSSTIETNPADNRVHTETTAQQTADGNVGVAIVKGNLIVTGDKFNNKLLIEAAEPANPDAFRITPIGGTRINGKFDSYQVHGIKLYVSFDMRAGNDTLLFSGPLTLRKALTIALGVGNDTVSMSQTTILNATTINADGGDDVISAVDCVFGGRLNLVLGAGNDTASFEDTTFNGAININTGAGNDSVTFKSSQVSGPTVIINDGQDDVVTIIDSIFAQLVDLRGGKGNDTLDAGPSRGNTFTKGVKTKSYESILP